MNRSLPPLLNRVVLPLSLAIFTAWSTHAVQVDSSFQVQVPNGTVHAVAIAPDGGVFLGGEFGTVNGTPVSFLGKVDRLGTVDLTFNANVSAPVFCLAPNSSGGLLVGGSFGFTSLTANGLSTQTHSGNGRVLAVAANGDKAVVGGTFWSDPDVFIARFDASNSVDSSFKSGLRLNSSMEAGVTALAVQPGGKIIVGGNFDSLGGFTSMARLNNDGSADTTFSNENGPVLYAKVIHVLAGGQILVGGVADSSGHGFVRRLNSDGTVDSTFAEAEFDGAVNVALVDGSGRIVVGGSFSSVNGAAHAHLARLNPDGTADEQWTLSANNVVEALVDSGGGTIIVGGAFSEIGGVRQSGIARLKELSALGSNATATPLQLSLSVETGKSYMIESSSDLRNWTQLKQQTASTESLAITATRGSAPRMFFRARLVN